MKEFSLEDRKRDFVEEINLQEGNAGPVTIHHLGDITADCLL
jgi:hypothetical protein